MVFMEGVKPLSEAVQSAVRSGFIISGLTTIVEELIYNSLDAGARKVFVSVGVNTGYVKVEDDGYGISRDGLVLVGERHATSKLHFHGKDDAMRSFGLRGEVLCSIADISLIEIITKVHGRPNGYRKVMKGRKCLYLGIDDDKQDVGTTVIVRDIFYNQPVRRRQMQSSAKKVLHSVRKCAVRIALVQPDVSFKVVDIESEDELLGIHASRSPFSVLSSNFGIKASSLHELSFSKGSLKLTGYLSGCSSSSLSKAIQYVYVNSRYVGKGQIHKALNRLADICRDQLSGVKGGKRGQPHAGPTYFLNLFCPLSSYDLNFEVSRTSVEFKDWAPILAFIEESVASFWSEETKRGESYNCETDQMENDAMEEVVKNMPSMEKDWLLKTCEISSKRRRVCNTEDDQGNGKQHSNLLKNTKKFLEPEAEGRIPHRNDITESGDVSSSSCIFGVKNSSFGYHFCEPDEELVSLSEDVWENDNAAIKRDDDAGVDYFTSSRGKDKFGVGDVSAGSNEVGSWWNLEVKQESDKSDATDDHEVLLRSRSWENLVHTPFNYENSRFHIDSFKAKKSYSSSIGGDDACGFGENFHTFERDQCRNEVASTWFFPKLSIESEMWKDLDFYEML